MIAELLLTVLSACTAIETGTGTVTETGSGTETGTETGILKVGVCAALNTVLVGGGGTDC